MATKRMTIFYASNASTDRKAHFETSSLLALSHSRVVLECQYIVVMPRIVREGSQVEKVTTQPIIGQH